MLMRAAAFLSWFIVAVIAYMIAVFFYNARRAKKRSTRQQENAYYEINRKQ